jgi:large subunit ribosomal protein L25
MEKIVLKATPRTVTGKKVGAIRRQGMLPAIMYGHNFESTPILLELHEASHILAPLTASQIVTITLDGKEHAALVREKQRDFLKNRLTHVDFQVVSLTEKIRAKVDIALEGISSAVKDFNGVVVTNLNEIEVEALPQDLPDRILIDLSKLKNIGDAIFVRDLNIPSGVTVLAHPEDLVVNVSYQAKEEGLEEGAGAPEPEVIEKGKKEEEE